jgi:hypothetical protein
MEKESYNILAVYDWFEVVCSGEVSWQVSGVSELNHNYSTNDYGQTTIVSRLIMSSKKPLIGRHNPFPS